MFGNDSAGRDDDAVRALARAVLHNCTATPCWRRTSADALELAGVHKGTIHVLVTTS